MKVRKILVFCILMSTSISYNPVHCQEYDDPKYIDPMYNEPTGEELLHPEGTYESEDVPVLDYEDYGDPMSESESESEDVPVLDYEDYRD